jgi:hypothetical protein
MPSMVGSGSSGSSSVFSGIFIAEEVYGVGDQKSTDTTIVYILRRPFEHDPEICLFC